MNIGNIESYVRSKVPDGCSVEVYRDREVGTVRVLVQRPSDKICFAVPLVEKVPQGVTDYQLDMLVERVRTTRHGGPDFSQGEAELGALAVTKSGARGAVVRVDDLTRTLQIDTLPGVHIPWADARWDKGER